MANEASLQRVCFSPLTLDQQPPSQPGTFTQLATGLIMAAVYTVLLAKVEPYAEKRDTDIAILSSAMIELTFVASFLMKSQNSVEDSYEAVGLGLLMVVCSVLLVVMFVFWSWKSFHDLNKSENSLALGVMRGGSRGGGGMEEGKRPSREGRLRLGLRRRLRLMRKGH